MNLSLVFLWSALLFSFLVVLVKGNRKADMVLAAVLVNSALSSWVAWQAIRGIPYSAFLNGGRLFGEIHIRVDALSGWFILLVNFTLITSILYGKHEMKPRKNRAAGNNSVYICFILNQIAMLGILCVQNALVFLCVWEGMTLCTFMMQIAEYGKSDSLKAGIRYLVRSHISLVFLILAFCWVRSKSGVFDFTAIESYAAGATPTAGYLLFLCFFIGFAIKAGFVPFHTRLPDKDTGTPAYLSALMSGVVIKLGIFGILRILLLLKTVFLPAGYTILAFSVLTGVSGVVLAILQHQVKKILSYHSIENTGIIGIGIGLGCIGAGMDNPYLAFAGFAGALLHTLNHSLFKSLLFYASGTVYRATHTLELEKLGGLIRKMPQTAVLFLIGSVAICGLPPFNGFISELLIYSGLFHAIANSPAVSVLVMGAVLFALALIGGLAILCFTKTFGIMFLGTSRSSIPSTIPEANTALLIPGYLVATGILAIGVFPQLFIRLVAPAVTLFMPDQQAPAAFLQLAATLQKAGLAAGGFLVLCILIGLVKRNILAGRRVNSSPTWSCGYPVSTPRLQYTAHSFARSFRKLVAPVLKRGKPGDRIKEIFPDPVKAQTEESREAFLMDASVRVLKNILGRLGFMQKGNEQSIE